nr:Cellulose synthase regulatory subunit [Klebsiella pneumoniae]
MPFYDPRDNRPLKLPMIFPGSPAVTQQQAAAIVASWFGSKAGWRGQQFPVYFNELPDRNAIVFATNDKRPDFLRDHPPVKAPTIEMIDNPNDPYVKLLVIFGRDDNDLLLAAKGLLRAIFCSAAAASPWTASKPCSRVSLTTRRTGCAPTARLPLLS